MMRGFYRFDPRFWRTEEARKIIDQGSDALAVALYLATCPHGTSLGIMHLPPGYIAADLRMTEERVRAALDAITAAGFARIDHAAGVIWILGYARTQNPGAPTALQRKGLRAIFAALPASTLRDEFERENAALIDDMPRHGEPVRPSSGSHGHPMANPWPTLGGETRRQGDKEPPYPPTGDHLAGSHQDEGDRERKNDPTTEPAEKDPPPYEKIRAAYHRICPSLPECVTLSEPRKKAIRRLWREARRLAREKGDGDAFAMIEKGFAAVEASSFHRGENGRAWRADFSWIVKPENFLKMFERGTESGNQSERAGEASALAVEAARCDREYRGTCPGQFGNPFPRCSRCPRLAPAMEARGRAAS